VGDVPVVGTLAQAVDRIRTAALAAIIRKRRGTAQTHHGRGRPLEAGWVQLVSRCAGPHPVQLGAFLVRPAGFLRFGLAALGHHAIGQRWLTGAGFLVAAVACIALVVLVEQRPPR
jgi:hypothetical protein